MSRYKNEFIDSPSKFVVDEKKTEDTGKKAFMRDPKWKASEVPSDGELNNPARRARKAFCKAMGISGRRYRKLQKRERG